MWPFPATGIVVSIIVRSARKERERETHLVGNGVVTGLLGTENSTVVLKEANRSVKPLLLADLGYCMPLKIFNCTSIYTCPTSAVNTHYDT